jgi:2-pyrone-4,6-dicarboxylate lactonase
VFGSPGRYPYGTDIRYQPPHEPLEAYLKLARRIGIVRYVFVQPSAYGFDNSCMLDAMRALDPAVRRGIIDLDETRTSDKQLAELDAVGVRGIRVNISPVRKPEPGLAHSMKPRIARLAKLTRESAGISTSLHQAG